MSANIFAAMVKAQRAYGPALKGKKNPHFGNNYADLAACVEAVTDALNNNGIAVAQVCHENPDGVTVETKFLHESGEEWSGGRLFVPSEKKNAQGFGSALTYARRYTLMAACGIAPEDDDGNGASGIPPKAPPRPAPPPTPPKQPASDLITDAQRKALYAGGKVVWGADERVKENIARIIGHAFESTKDLTKGEASAVLDEINKLGRAANG